ncbi:MAG: hypothetical protein IPI58_04525 [Alphaproteobacteria bacterium]|nr:MAG: hypothetical protein IPI58_04525 [Alphaproteobacteria bacterium]
MAQTYSQRAPFNDWWYWGECLIKRFGTAAEVYRENGERERADELAMLARRLKDNFAKPVNAARGSMKTEQEKRKVQELEEEAIFNAATMYRDIIANLPFISQALQDFLYCSWQTTCWPKDEQNGEEGEDGKTGGGKTGGGGKAGGGPNAREAKIIEIFWGPREHQDEGIRSGQVADGGLAGIIYNLLVAERTNSSRTPTDYGQAMQASATQQSIATTQQKWEKAGVQMNFKPPGGI